MRVTSSRSWPRYVSAGRAFEDPFVEAAGLRVPFVPADGEVRDFPLACIFELPLEDPATSASVSIVFSARRRLAVGCEADLFREAEASAGLTVGSDGSLSSCESRRLLPKTCLGIGTMEECRVGSGSRSDGSDGERTSRASVSEGLGAERTVLKGS